VNLSECYNGLKKLNLDLDIDSSEIVEEVSRMRELWKPRRVRVVLLAESHAHTRKEDFVTPWRVRDTSYGGKYVRFVYCLANGERELVPSVHQNKGTSQFWKIFYSCLHRVSDNRDFAPILHSTPSDQRIANKIDLLSSLKEAGIWLTDVSIVGINHLKEVRARKAILKHCWQFTGPMLESLDPPPKHVIVIGKLVEKTLKEDIVSLDPHYTPLPQPQAHLPAPGYFPFYKTYHEICSRFKNWVYPQTDLSSGKES
jgi:hypothetical protein